MIDSAMCSRLDAGYAWSERTAQAVEMVSDFIALRVSQRAAR